MNLGAQIGKLWQLNVPSIALIAFAISLLFTFLAITVGGLACFLATAPTAVAYLVVFGSALLAAVSRSRFFPTFPSIQFLGPILVTAILIVLVGYGGFWTARFLNDTLFHIPEKHCGS